MLITSNLESKTSTESVEKLIDLIYEIENKEKILINNNALRYIQPDWFKHKTKRLI
jgi:hypothetical protein